MKILTIFVLLLVFPQYGNCTSTPEEIAEIRHVQEGFMEIEENFEKGKWDEAEKHFETTNEHIGHILPSLRKHSNTQDLNNFRNRFLGLKSDLYAKHREFVEESFTSMQKAFLILANNYTFRPPLFLEIVGDYIKDIEEELNEGDKGKVSFEMHDVGDLIEEYDDYLVEHGVSHAEIDNFVLEAYHLKQAIKHKDRKKIQETLKVLSGIQKSFASKFN